MKVFSWTSEHIWASKSWQMTGEPPRKTSVDQGGELHRSESVVGESNGSGEGSDQNGCERHPILICKTKAQLQGSPSHNGFLEFLRKIAPKLELPGYKFQNSNTTPFGWIWFIWLPPSLCRSEVLKLWWCLGSMSRPDSWPDPTFSAEKVTWALSMTRCVTHQQVDNYRYPPWKKCEFTQQTRMIQVIFLRQLCAPWLSTYRWPCCWEEHVPDLVVGRTHDAAGWVINGDYSWRCNMQSQILQSKCPYIEELYHCHMWFSDGKYIIIYQPIDSIPCFGYFLLQSYQNSP